MPLVPESIERLHGILLSFDGARSCEIRIADLSGLSVQSLEEEDQYADLPHLLLRRTGGGQQGERLVVAELTFDPLSISFYSVEFLAWWVTDLARGGDLVQFRPVARAPKDEAGEVQLGRTLRFVIEWLFTDQTEKSVADLEHKMGDFAASLERAVNLHADALACPVELLDDDYDDADDGHHHCEHDIEEIRAAAAAGDPGAQFHLALHLENGDFGDPDPSGAFTLYEQAARQNFPPAILMLGRCFEDGIGVEADPHAAVKYYHQAAEEDFPVALGFIGHCYEDGVGVPQDMAAAAKWYRRGADLEDPGCQAQLGECYELGKGLKRDYAQALKWYRAALEQGWEDVEEAIARVEASLG